MYQFLTIMKTEAFLKFKIEKNWWQLSKKYLYPKSSLMFYCESVL